MVKPLDINAFVGIPSIKNDRQDIIETRKPGRPKRWDTSVEARFMADTKAEMKAQCKEGETQIDFIDEAVRREIARRKAENESS
jgi:hypothetical protein